MCMCVCVPRIDVPLVPLASPVERDLVVVGWGRMNEARHGLLERMRCGLHPAALGCVVGQSRGDALVVRCEDVLGVVGEARAHRGGGRDVGRGELLDDGRGRAARALLDDGLGERVWLHGRERIEL
jgi:hypothetical protein